MPSGGTPDLVGWLTSGGFTALAAVLLWFALTAYKRETDRCDRLEKRLEDEQQFFRDKILPAMTSSSEALREATEVLREQQERRRRHGGN